MNEFYKFDTPDRFREITITHTPSRIPLDDPNYNTLRAGVWEKKKAELGGKKLWDGEIYTVEHVVVDTAQQVTQLVLSTCKYSDILAKNHAQCNSMALPAAFTNCFVSVVLVEKDMRIGVGTIGSGTIQETGSIDLIGGSLNKDELVVSSTQDIENLAIKEIGEELGIPLKEGILIPLGIFIYNGTCNFMFRWNIESSSLQELRLDPAEITSVQFLSTEELIAYSGTCTGEINFLRQNLHLLNLPKNDSSF